jgi:hypothetical protein
MTNPMVEPIYLTTSPSTDKIPLTGRVLIFGAGKMIHERNCFSFDGCSEVVLYDPYNKDWEDLGFIPDGVIRTKLEARSFTEILTEEPFDRILALFSLHYESQWLFALEHIFNSLKEDGIIYFAEDRGFRAILDGNFKIIDNINEIFSDVGVAIPETVKKQVQEIFKNRNTDRLSIPWYPDISASNYSLVFKILSFIGEAGENKIFNFSEKINLKNNLQKFLPWRENFCNPELTKKIAETIHTILQKEDEDITVIEKIYIYEFTKKRGFPDIKNEQCLDSKSIWDIVAYNACNNIAKVVIPSDSKRGDDRKNYLRSVLGVTYLNIFKHFKSTKGAEIILGVSGEIPNLIQSTRIKEDLPCATFNQDSYIDGCNITIKFDDDQFLTDFLDKVKSSGRKYNGDLLYEKLKNSEYAIDTVIYFWTSSNCDISIEGTINACQNNDLKQIFSSQEHGFITPDCFYIFEPIASNFESVDKYLITSSSVIYLQNIENHQEELSCLIYLIRGMLPILAGRSAFMEMWAAKIDSRTISTTREIINNMKDASESLSSIQNYITQLSGMFGDYASLWKKGELSFEVIVRELDRYFLIDPDLHTPSKHKTEQNRAAFYNKLLIDRESNFYEFRDAMRDLLNDLKKSDFWNERIVDKLFELWDIKNIKDINPIYLAKSLSKRELPGNWLYTLLIESKIDSTIIDRLKNQVNQFNSISLEVQNPQNHDAGKVLRFMVALQRLINVQEVVVKQETALTQEEFLLTLSILADYRGNDELQNFSDIIKGISDDSKVDIEGERSNIFAILIKGTGFGVKLQENTRQDHELNIKLSFKIRSLA